MTGAPALRCPSCRRSLGSLDWHDGQSGYCRSCLTPFDAQLFPALTHTRPAVRPQAVVVAEDSTCFFHQENQAEKVCDACGRFLCAVCAIPFGGGVRCPTCLAKESQTSAVAVPDRTLYGSLALSLAFLPLLLWMLTFITAPIALGVAIYGWRKPGSLVRGPRKWTLITAGLAAAAEITIWVLVLGKILLR